MTYKLKKFLEAACNDFKPDKNTPMFREILENYKNRKLTPENKERIAQFEKALLQKSAKK